MTVLGDGVASERTFQPPVSVTAALVLANGLSVLSSTLLVVAFFSYKALRRHPAGLVLHRCFADALFCIAALVSHLYFRDGASSGSFDCRAFSFLVQASTLAGELYFLCMSIDLKVSMNNPFTNFRRNMRVYHLVSWGLALVSATALLVVRDGDEHCVGRDNYLSICWIRNFNSEGSLSMPFWLFFFAPLLVIYISALVLLGQASRRLRQGLPETFEARLEIFRATLRFNLAYVAFWVAAAAVYSLISAIDSRSPSDVLSLLLAVCLGSKGTVTAVIWLLTFGKELTCTCRRGCVPRSVLLQQAAGKSSTASNDDAADLRPFLNIQLRREVIFYCTLGIAKSVARVARDGNACLDADYGRHGIRVNVVWLSRRKEESGLFDLEANKRRAAEAALASQLAAPSATVPDGGHSASSRRLPVNTHQPPLPPGEPRTRRGQQQHAPSSPAGLRSNLRAALPHRSASDMRMPLLSQARESEVQDSFNAEAPPTRVAVAPGSSDAAATMYVSAREPPGGSSSRGHSGVELALNGSINSAPLRQPGKGGGDGTAPRERGAATMRHRHGAAPRGQQERQAQAGAVRGLAPSVLGDHVHDPGAGRLRCCGGGGSSLQRHRFVDFEPFLFRRLRLQAGISDAEYVLALSRTRREKFSEGASSSFFYYSLDDRLLVKTLNDEEVDVLLALLHPYSQYLSRQPHSLLPRFFGLHAITMYGQTFFFCVMQNVLAGNGAAIADKFDLKGSWVNRHRSPLEKGQKAECRYCGQRFRVGEGGNRFATHGSGGGKLACPARVNRPHEPNVVLKDNDLHAKLRLLPETGQALGDQISRDVEFLRGMRVMDFSLLLATHRTRYKLVDSHGPAGAGLPYEAGLVLAGLAAPSPSPSPSPSRQPSAAPQLPLADAQSLSSDSLPAEPPHAGAAPAASECTAGGGLQRNPLRVPPAGGSGPAPAPLPAAKPLPPAAEAAAAGGCNVAGASLREAVLLANASRPVTVTGSINSGGGGAPSALQLQLGGGSSRRLPHTTLGGATASVSDGGSVSEHADALGPGAAASWGIDLNLAEVVGSPGGSGLHAAAVAGVAALAGGGRSTATRHPGAGPAPRAASHARQPSGWHAAEPASGRERPPAGQLSRQPSLQLARPSGAPSPALYLSDASVAADEEDMGGGVFAEAEESLPTSGGSRGRGLTAHTEAAAAIVSWPSPRLAPSSGAPAAAAGAAAGWEGRDPSGRLGRGGSSVPSNAGSVAPSSVGAGSGEADSTTAGLLAAAGLGFDGDAAGSSCHVVPFHREYRGGLRATVIEGPGVYYLGLIDVLQRYTWGKWLERQFKVRLLCKSGNGVSSIDPDSYAQRFRSRVIGQLVDGWTERHSAPGAADAATGGADGSSGPAHPWVDPA